MFGKSTYKNWTKMIFENIPSYNFLLVVTLHAEYFVFNRYATSQAEFCSALMAFKRLKKLRKKEFGSRTLDQVWRGYANQHQKKERKVHYILVFAGNKKSQENDDDQDNDESYLYLDNMAKEKITQVWTREGGEIGGRNLDPNDPARGSPMYVCES